MGQAYYVGTYTSYTYLCVCLGFHTASEGHTSIAICMQLTWDELYLPYIYENMAENHFEKLKKKKPSKNGQKMRFLFFSKGKKIIFRVSHSNK